MPEEFASRHSIVISSQAAPARSSRLDAVESWSKIIAAVAVPLLVVYFGSLLTQAQHSQDLQRDYVKIALGILQDQSVQDTELRAWAVSLLNSNAPVQLAQATRDSLESGRSNLPESIRLVAGTEPTLRQVIATSETAASRRTGLPVDITEVSDEHAGSIPKLIDELAVKDRFSRQWAAEALGRIGAPAVAPLLEAMETRAEEIDLSDAAMALGLIGPPAAEAIPLLERLQSSHKDLVVRTEAAVALARIRQGRDGAEH